MALELERGLTKNALRLESLEREGQNIPPSTKKGPKLADLSSGTSGAKPGNCSRIFPSMGDGTENISAPNFPSFSFSPDISVCKQNYFFSGGITNLHCLTQ
jgi:hypothetical protein